MVYFAKATAVKDCLGRIDGREAMITARNDEKPSRGAYHTEKGR